MERLRAALPHCRERSENNALHTLHFPKRRKSGKEIGELKRLTTKAPKARTHTWGAGSHP